MLNKMVFKIQKIYSGKGSQYYLFLRMCVCIDKSLFIKNKTIIYLNILLGIDAQTE